ncbi:hypothetical protein K3495_g4181 [Podosphaera aphanis]|nr:hypothetical protein K3495_g4181 [Podosphaera aphanis]
MPSGLVMLTTAKPPSESSAANIPATVIDLQVLYPAGLVPDWLRAVKGYYVAQYQDQFFVAPPPFFRLFVWSEILFQAPVMGWSLAGLYHDSPRVPLVLLPFAVVVFLTTLTCMVEYSFWEVSLQQKWQLTSLYGPYLMLSLFMGIDMFMRLNKMIRVSTSLAKKTQ